MFLVFGVDVMVKKNGINSWPRTVRRTALGLHCGVPPQCGAAGSATETPPGRSFGVYTSRERVVITEGALRHSIILP